MSLAAFHPEARSEFIESARYYQDHQPGLGYRFVDAVRRAVALVEKYPDLYREIEPSMRQCRVLRFPYGLVYRLRDGQIQIIAVMHLHRKPGYWRERLGTE